MLKGLLAALGIVFGAAASAGELLENQVFDRYSPLVAADEFSRRVFTPTTHDRLQRFQAHLGRKAIEHTVDLADERFEVYVPSRKPETGYGLLVYISPEDNVSITRHWKRALDRSGVIYVSARRSGNTHNVYERRIPLALHAYENIRARYAIDPNRVVISGYSGGSRTAIRTAAAYADVFTGALFIGGAKVMGEEDFAPPPFALMTRMQREMRILYSTGSHDMPNRRLDGHSIEALKKRCVAGVFKIFDRKVGHELPDERTLVRALARLDAPLDERILASQKKCMKNLQPQIESDIAAAEAAWADGNSALAGERLGNADLTWGGFATERLVRLARILAPH